MTIDIQLKKKPKNCVLIEGFPGFGLVGTISNEFLIDHLKTELIGRVIVDDMPTMVAIHEGEVVEPLGIFYNKKYNLVFLHAITPSSGHEWQLSEVVTQIAKQLQIKEIICLEGVGSATAPTGKGRVFYYSQNPAAEKKFKKAKIEQLKEGIIIGVTGALLIRSDIPVTCIFAETASNLPDSKAAAKVIQTIDMYLGLKVDYKPLLDQADKFENKLKGLLTESQKAQELSEKKKLSYMG